ncbi:hypothetical protein EXIGLDRAFT_462573 [Exidia glandulosa HHB12029]|uniref:Uncharacterized protein n=1 Tax=Exidia glandulosa HHB12029 TaxID=1314781 RepID=A0A165K3L2_EXIGL|nr:hypothetical protein EXIGLDRAFT_462573 [Exidia glandulosa HHB12029]
MTSATAQTSRRSPAIQLCASNAATRRCGNPCTGELQASPSAPLCQAAQMSKSVFAIRSTERRRLSSRLHRRRVPKLQSSSSTSCTGTHAIIRSEEIRGRVIRVARGGPAKAQQAARRALALIRLARGAAHASAPHHEKAAHCRSEPAAREETGRRGVRHSECPKRAKTRTERSR